MTAERKSETLIVSEHYMAERVRRWGLYKWAIWRISDAMSPEWKTPVVFYAQNGHDAMQMIMAFELNTERPVEAVAS